MEMIEAYKFCPRCGANFERKDDLLQCNKCGLSFYINPKPTTTVILVNDNGEYLLTKRAFDPGKGLWDFPGGFVEHSETFEQNAQRELREELNIEIGQLHYIGSVSVPYLFQEVNYATLSVVFISKFLKNAEPRPGDDVSSYQFFAPDKVPMDKLAFPAMRTNLEQAEDFLKNNRL